MTIDEVIATQQTTGKQGMTIDEAIVMQQTLIWNQTGVGGGLQRESVAMAIEALKKQKQYELLIEEMVQKREEYDSLIEKNLTVTRYDAALMNNHIVVDVAYSDLLKNDKPHFRDALINTVLRMYRERNRD